MSGSHGETEGRSRGAALRWALVLLLCGGVAAAAAAGTEAEGEPDKPDAPPRLIKMWAENWKWTPKVIRVPQGTRLRIEVESFDAPHSFVLKPYGLKVPLPEGKKTEIEFIADRKGTFRWRCGRPCGDGCPKMTGKLIVE